MIQKNSKAFSLLVAGLVLCQPLTVSAEDAAAQGLLEKMWQADRIAGFSGQFVYSNGSHIETMRIERHSNYGGLSERLVSSAGGISDVRRDRQFVYRVDPSTKLILVSPVEDYDQREYSLKKAASLTVYEVREEGVDIVADHLCRRINVLPRDKMRYGYGFCIEPETGVLLSSRTVGPEGETLEQMVFTRVVLDTPGVLKPELEKLEQNGYQRKQADLPVSPIHKKLLWSLGDLPEGFELLEEGERFLTGNEQVVRHLLFSDGIANVSVFVQHEPSLAAGTASVSGGLSILTEQQGDYRVTFMGEVPLKTLAHMAASFSVREEVGE